VTGFDTPESQAAAAALAGAGYRLCVLHAKPEAAAALAQLPGHARLQHQSILTDLSDAHAVCSAALEARERLGQVTALLHVVSPAAPSASDAFEPQQLLRDLQLGASAFLGLALGLLPGMLATQTGCLCVLTSAPAAGVSFANGALGGAASLGALLGATRQLADQCEGTQLRSIVLCTDAAVRGPLSGPLLAAVARQLGAEPGPDRLESGWFSRLDAPKIRGPIEFLRLPPSPASSLGVNASSPAEAPVASSRNDRVGEKLAQTFRAAFGLAPHVDLSKCAVGSVARWDSLGHLKLMMEVEQALRVRLPAEALGRIQSYRDLEQAVRAYLPAQ
jgi:NAD(P)-dependent dehydrogenase (short-subunit alcohol dehydrogenase family)/acyl carrier protein